MIITRGYGEADQSGASGLMENLAVEVLDAAGILSCNISIDEIQVTVEVE